MPCHWNYEIGCIHQSGIDPTRSPTLISADWNREIPLSLPSDFLRAFGSAPRPLPSLSANQQLATQILPDIALPKLEELHQQRQHHAIVNDMHEFVTDP